MRKICIDLSQDNRYVQKIFAGFVEEHNETELEVILPTRMLNNDISYYYFKFQTATEEVINSLNIYKSSLIDGNKIVISLWEQLLDNMGDLTFCVCAEKIKEDGSLDSRGKTSSCILQISKSPSGKNTKYYPDANADELQKMINSALQDAKENGEFKGEKGVSGVYLGSGEMPEDYNVQIDPDGEPIEVYNKEEADNKFATKEEVGNIETALDNIIAEQEAIIAIQNALIGGDSV